MLSRPSFHASTLASVFVALSLFACTAESGSADDLGDDALADSAESELKANGFVGRWSDPSSAAGQFASITLKAGGKYDAAITICPAAEPGGVSCMAMPRDESGAFTILKSGSKQTLRLVPKGAAVRRYGISFAATVAVVGAPRAIELTRSGTSQVLNEDKGGGGGVSCGKSTCAPGLVCCNPLSAICTKPGDLCAF